MMSTILAYTIFATLLVGAGICGNGRRSACPDGCITCNSAMECEQCWPGYYGDICQYTCASHCDLCNKKNGNCLKCTDGYFNKGGGCHMCMDGCVNCDNNTSCSKCKDGFVMHNVQCIMECSSNTNVIPVWHKKSNISRLTYACMVHRSSTDKNDSGSFNVKYTSKCQPSNGSYDYCEHNISITEKPIPTEQSNTDGCTVNFGTIVGCFVGCVSSLWIMIEKVLIPLYNYIRRSKPIASENRLRQPMAESGHVVDMTIVTSKDTDSRPSGTQTIPVGAEQMQRNDAECINYGGNKGTVLDLEQTSGGDEVEASLESLISSSDKLKVRD